MELYRHDADGDCSNNGVLVLPSGPELSELSILFMYCWRISRVIFIITVSVQLNLTWSCTNDDFVSKIYFKTEVESKFGLKT